MKIKSIYSFSFYSDDLTNDKYNFLTNKAKKIIEIKNYVTIEIHKNMPKWITFSKFDFVKYFNPIIQKEFNQNQKIKLSGQDIQNLLVDVYTMFQNRIEQAKTKFDFKVQDKIKISYYKKATKCHKKGDLKEIIIKYKQTKLSKTLSFLLKTGMNKNDILTTRDKNIRLLNQAVIKNNKKEIEKLENKIKVYNQILIHINKFGDRLFKLVALRLNRLLTKRFKKPIEFTKLTFTSCNQLNKLIIDFNNNKNSIVQGFISLQTQNYKDLKILELPIKINKSYYGNLKDYGTKNTSYTVKIENKRIRIILTKSGKREIVEASNNTDYLGVDTNIKHNLFALSDNTTLDYDRELLNDYVKFLKKLDKKKTNKSKISDDKEFISTLSKKDSKKYDKWQIRFNNHLKFKCRELVNYAKNNNFNHLILEDLELIGKLSSRNNEFLGFKYSRLIRLLNLNSIKHYLKEIAYKNGIAVTFIQPEYTSQECNKCHNIDKNNRKTQEVFNCTLCNHITNADLSSSINICNRVANSELSKMFLILNKNGELVPKKFKRRNIIKEKIDELFYVTRINQVNSA